MSENLGDRAARGRMMRLRLLLRAAALSADVTMTWPEVFGNGTGPSRDCRPNKAVFVSKNGGGFSRAMGE